MGGFPETLEQHFHHAVKFALLGRWQVIDVRSHNVSVRLKPVLGQPPVITLPFSAVARTRWPKGVDRDPHAIMSSRSE